jgi:hypothetical protein
MHEPDRTCTDHDSLGAAVLLCCSNKCLLERCCGRLISEVHRLAQLQQRGSTAAIAAVAQVFSSTVMVAEGGGRLWVARITARARKGALLTRSAALPRACSASKHIH